MEGWQARVMATVGGSFNCTGKKQRRRRNAGAGDEERRMAGPQEEEGEKRKGRLGRRR